MADKLPLLVGLDWHMQYIALKIVRSSLEVEKNRILNLLYINQVKSAVAEEERLKCLENEKNENNEKNKKKGESERKEDPKSTPLRRKSLGQMPRKGSKGMPQILISQTYNNNNNNNNNDDDDDNSVITISTMNTLRTMKSIGTIGTVGTMRANQQNKQNSNQSNNPTRRNSGDSSHIKKIRLISQSFVSPPADPKKTQKNTKNILGEKVEKEEKNEKAENTEKREKRMKNGRKKSIFEKSCTAELCRTGALKSVCLLLLHGERSVRYEASKVHFINAYIIQCRYNIQCIRCAMSISL